MKKVLVIGACGTLGQAVSRELESDCHVISAGRTSGMCQVDVTQPESVSQMMQKHADVDAVVCVTAGTCVFEPVATLSTQAVEESLQTKLLGQVSVVLQGLQHLGPHVSFTLTTGLLNADPIPSGSVIALVNGGIEGFVKAAAIDMPDNIVEILEKHKYLHSWKCK